MQASFSTIGALFERLGRRRDAFQAQVDRRLTAMMSLVFKAVVERGPACQSDPAPLDLFLEFCRAHGLDAVDHEIVTLHDHLYEVCFGFEFIRCEILPLVWALLCRSGCRIEEIGTRQMEHLFTERSDFRCRLKAQGILRHFVDVLSGPVLGARPFSGEHANGVGRPFLGSGRRCALLSALTLTARSLLGKTDKRKCEVHRKYTR